MTSTEREAPNNTTLPLLLLLAAWYLWSKIDVQRSGFLSRSARGRRFRLNGDSKRDRRFDDGQITDVEAGGVRSP